MPVARRWAGCARAALVAWCTLVLVATGLGTGVAAAADAALLPPGPPFGWFDNAAPTDGGAVISGWVIDPDTPAPASVALHIDSTVWKGPFLANGWRPDVGQAHDGYGDNHGFVVFVPLAPGPHSVCVHAENLGGGPPQVLGCRYFAVDVPFGATERIARVPEGIAVSGWIIDDDAGGGQAPVPFAVNVGGTWYGPYSADAARPDLNGVHDWAGNRHGFAVVVPLPPPGPVWVCVHPLDVGSSPPRSTVQRCEQILVSHAVEGYIDVFGAGTGDIKLSGWAFDPDSHAPLDITVTVNAQTYGPFRAEISRPDVAAAFGVADRHGYDVRVPLPAGGYGVAWAYAGNVGPGVGPVLLGCSEVLPVPAGSGSGRRVVYDNLGQRVWLVGSDSYTVRTYPISGRYLDPAPGTLHRVYGKFRYADAGHDGITMEYFVAFNPAGLGYGFHTIPTWGDGTPLQSESELGQFRSAGCVRQGRSDAVFMWNWSQVGGLVVVV